MHVLTFVWDHVAWGDLHKYVADTVEFLLSQGHEVTLVCSPGPLAQKMTAVGIKVWSTDFQRWDEFIATGVLNHAYDIIHAHPGPSRSWGLNAQDELELPFFITFHDGWIDDIKDYAARCEGIFSISPSVRRSVLDGAPAAADRLFDMPNCVPAELKKSKNMPSSKERLWVSVVLSEDGDNTPLAETLYSIWRTQAERKEKRIHWVVTVSESEIDRARMLANELCDVLGETCVDIHELPESNQLRPVDTGSQIRMVQGHAVIGSLAEGMPTIAVGSRGCFGLVTRANFWEAADCDFGGFGLTSPTNTTQIVDALQRLLGSFAESAWNETDCGEVARAYFSRELWGGRLLAHYTGALKQRHDAAPSTPFMPKAEIEYLTRAYAEARVILEYGSGGSTEIAARMPGKYIISVESDIVWARELRRKLAASDLPSHPIVYHADIGPTGAWGRPLNDRAWRSFHNYPLSIWDQSWFRHPDLVLIDGRFRTACLATVLLRATRPVRVLFDDYSVRPLYHQIEEIVQPIRMIGRMAEFHIEPGMTRPRDFGLLLEQFFWVSLHGTGEAQYQVFPPKGAN